MGKGGVVYFFIGLEPSVSACVNHPVSWTGGSGGGGGFENGGRREKKRREVGRRKERGRRGVLTRELVAATRDDVRPSE